MAAKTGDTAASRSDSPPAQEARVAQVVSLRGERLPQGDNTRLPATAPRPGEMTPRENQPVARPATLTQLARGTRKRLGLLSFLAVVALPTLVSAWYFLAIASPQYVSEFRFGVRSGDASRNDATSIFQGMASASQIGLDSYVVVQYIQSAPLVASLRSEFDFNDLFMDQKIDRLSRLSKDAASEQVLDYWKGHVDPFFDLTTGSVSVRVRAFTPVAAQNLAKAIIAHSEKLVNQLSARAREDAVRNARDEVGRAETRLRDSLSAIRNFRDVQQRINPEKEADARMAAIGRMREELAKANAEISVRQSSSLAADSPTVRSTRARIQALQEQIALAERQLTTTQPANRDSTSNVLSADMGTFDVLESERRFAEDYYKATLTSLERARATADRQISYLAVFVAPSLPEDSLYPKIWQSILISALVAFGVWVFGLIVLRSIRDHR